MAELPSVCAGDLDTPIVSGLGTNASLPPPERRVPLAVIFGGGVPDDQVQSLTEAIHSSAPNAKIVRVTRQDILAAGGEGPNPEVIAGVIKNKLGEMFG